MNPNPKLDAQNPNLYFMGNPNLYFVCVLILSPAVSAAELTMQLALFHLHIACLLPRRPAEQRPKQPLIQPMFCLYSCFAAKKNCRMATKTAANATPVLPPFCPYLLPTRTVQQTPKQ